MKNTAAVCLAAGDAKPPKSDTASVGNHRSDDVARFLRLPLIDSPFSPIWMALLIKRSIMASAMVLSPMYSYQFFKGNYETMMTDLRSYLHIPEHTRSAFRVCSQQPEVQK